MTRREVILVLALVVVSILLCFAMGVSYVGHNQQLEDLRNRYARDVQAIARFAARQGKVRQKTGEWPQPSKELSGELPLHLSSHAAGDREDLYGSSSHGPWLKVKLERNGWFDVEVSWERPPAFER